jgi:hypothetical protein
LRRLVDGITQRMLTATPRARTREFDRLTQEPPRVLAGHLLPRQQFPGPADLLLSPYLDSRAAPGKSPGTGQEKETW